MLVSVGAQCGRGGGESRSFKLLKNAQCAPLKHTFLKKKSEISQRRMTAIIRVVKRDLNKFLPSYVPLSSRAPLFSSSINRSTVTKL